MCHLSHCYYVEVFYITIDLTKKEKIIINFFFIKMKDTVQEQSRLWANLIERQQNEEKQLNNEHVEQQCVQLLQLLQEAQKQRKKDIEARQKSSSLNINIYI